MSKKDRIKRKVIFVKEKTIATDEKRSSKTNSQIESEHVESLNLSVKNVLREFCLDTTTHGFLNSLSILIFKFYRLLITEKNLKKN